MTAVNPDGSRQAVVEATLVLLKRMGLTPADLAAIPQHRREVPTFAEYILVVAAAVSARTRRVYSSYWNRVVDQRDGRNPYNRSCQVLVMSCIHAHHSHGRQGRQWRAPTCCPYWRGEMSSAVPQQYMRLLDMLRPVGMIANL